MYSVIYLMSGKPHLPYLLVSLYSLRRHWGGRVVVYAWPDSFDEVEEISKDDRLAIEIEPWEPEYRGKNSQFICKQHVVQSLPSTEVGLYLDADTMVTGSLSPLFELASKVPFVATQFNNWPTNSGMIPKRIERLRGRSEEIDGLVDQLVNEPYPSVNGGVFACRSDSPVLSKWIEWTWMFRDIFIADETVLHALVARYSPHLVVWPNGEYNSSPKFFVLPEDRVKIWHFHGDCNVKLFENKQGQTVSKSQKGIELWWPMYQECLEANIGNVQTWRGFVGNKYLARLESIVNV